MPSFVHGKLKSCFRIPGLHFPCMVDAPILINTCSGFFAVVVFLQCFGNICVSGKLPHVYARFVPWTWITQPLSNSKDSHFRTEKTGLVWGKKFSNQLTRVSSCKSKTWLSNLRAQLYWNWVFHRWVKMQCILKSWSFTWLLWMHLRKVYIG